MPITPVEASEYTQWKSVFAAFIDHMSATLPETQYAASWARIHPTSTDKKPEMWCLVAREDDGTIVGLVHWLEFARSWKEGKETYMEDLFVLPSARGKGYGKALILAAAEAARDQGSDAMHWTTGLENVWGGRLYDRVAHFGHRWYSMDLPYRSREEKEAKE